MRLPRSRRDDSDVIRERLRALLDEARRPGGWLPDDLPDDTPEETPTDSPDDSPDDEDSARTWPVADGGDQDRPDLPAGMGRHRAPDRTVRWDPGRLGGRSLFIAGLAAAVLVAGYTWSQRPEVEPAPPPRVESSAAPATPPVGEAAETSATVVVSVVGLVTRPGLVTLPSGARVAAAIEAAGGLLPEADPGSVNLAAVVSDGQQIAVGVPGAASAGTGPAGAPPAGLVDLNAAGAAELDALPGIGPVLAQRIVDFRTRNGPFTSVDQLDDVPGIGPAIFAELAHLVTV